MPETEPRALVSWSIEEDVNKDLCFLYKGNLILRLTGDGTLTISGKKVVKEKETIHITNNARGGPALNATNKGDSTHPDGFNGWSFWMKNPDSESDLQIAVQ